MKKMRKIDLSSLTNERMDYLYQRKKFSAVEIANLYNVSVCTIYRHMEAAGIKRRNVSEARKVAHTDPSIKYGFAPDELEELYLNKKMTLTQISVFYGVTISTVGRWMDMYGIKKRTRAENGRLGRTARPIKHNFTKEELEELYYKKSLTLPQIGEIYAVDAMTVARWMDIYGLDRRSKSEYTKGKKTFLGKKHSEKTKQKMRDAAIKRWESPEYISNVMNGLHAKPNKLELTVENILQDNFPGEWKYNGDFSCGIVIGGLIPDFVNTNGEKMVIEVFGDPWHDPNNTFLDNIDWKRTKEGRISIFAQYGYKCVIIWDSDLRHNDNEEFIVNMIRGI